MTPMNPADLFRKEARDHLSRGEDGLRRLEVSPLWTWALLWVLLAALGAALVLAVVGSVEVNSRAIGILRPATGVRVLVSQVSGTVASVPLSSGEEVSRGDTVLQIDAPDLRGQLLEAQRQVGLLESDFRQVSQQQDHLHQQQVAQTKTRLIKLTEQVDSERASLDVHRRKFKAMRSLESSAVVSGFAVLDAQEAVAQAERRLAGTEQSLALARQELAAMDSRRQTELWEQRQSLDSARSRQDTMLLANRQTRIVAPQDGLIEALLVKPGDDVQPGQAVGKLIPSGTPLEVVSFLPEKDRAFVRVGSEVRLELDQLPYGEYGTLGARVVRISDDLASPHEVTQALGDERKLDGPAFRVVLAITEQGSARNADVTLSSGMLMKVRYTLRRQRPITIVLEPLRKWLH
jgi:membrane fusion protein